MHKKIKELYSGVLRSVLDEFDISEEDLFASNREECVNARMALINSLSGYMSDNDIATCTQKMRRCSVCAIRNRYNRDAAPWTVRNCIEIVRKTLRQG